MFIINFGVYQFYQGIKGFFVGKFSGLVRHLGLTDEAICDERLLNSLHPISKEDPLSEDHFKELLPELLRLLFESIELSPLPIPLLLGLLESCAATVEAVLICTTHLGWLRLFLFL